MEGIKVISVALHSSLPALLFHNDYQDCYSNFEESLSTLGVGSTYIYVCDYI